MVLITKPSEVLTVLRYISELKPDFPSSADQLIVNMLALVDDISSKYRDRLSPSADTIETVYRCVGRLAWMYLNHRLSHGLIPDRLDEESFAKLLLTKHEAYGDKVLIRWSHTGMFMRIDSKISRLINLTNDPSISKANESIEDTVTDILGYCVLGLIMQKIHPNLK